MAILQCTTCGHVVSDRARCCPSCGTPIEQILAIRNVTAQRGPSGMNVPVADDDTRTAGVTGKANQTNNVMPETPSVAVPQAPAETPAADIPQVEFSDEDADVFADMASLQQSSQVTTQTTGEPPTANGYDSQDEVWQTSTPADDNATAQGGEWWGDTDSAAGQPVDSSPAAPPKEGKRRKPSERRNNNKTKNTRRSRRQAQKKKWTWTFCIAAAVVVASVLFLVFYQPKDDTPRKKIQRNHVKKEERGAAMTPQEEAKERKRLINIIDGAIGDEMNTGESLQNTPAKPVGKNTKPIAPAKPTSLGKSNAAKSVATQPNHQYSAGKKTMSQPRQVKAVETPKTTSAKKQVNMNSQEAATAAMPKTAETRQPIKQTSPYPQDRGAKAVQNAADNNSFFNGN